MARAVQDVRPVYRILLRAEPGVDAERALRALLKTALRRFGLRCLSVEEVPQAAGELGPAKSGKRDATHPHHQA